MNTVQPLRDGDFITLLFKYLLLTLDKSNRPNSSRATSASRVFTTNTKIKMKITSSYSDARKMNH